MKPVPQLNAPARSTVFPLIDYGFQSATNTTAASSAGTRDASQLWKLSTDFFAGEAGREWIAEFVVFGAIVLVAIWPVLFALHSVTRMVRGY